MQTHFNSLVICDDEVRDPPKDSDVWQAALFVWLDGLRPKRTLVKVMDGRELRDDRRSNPVCRGGKAGDFGLARYHALGMLEFTFL